MLAKFIIYDILVSSLDDLACHIESTVMSNWKETQEVNGNLNARRREIADAVEFLKKQIVDEDNQDLITRALDVFQAADNVLSDSYLSSGYQYDDADPRNQMDVFGDSWETRTAARNGTSAEDEMRSEIQRKVAMQHFAMMQDELFKNLDGFSEWYHNRQDELSESWTDERDDDHDW